MRIGLSRGRPGGALGRATPGTELEPDEELARAAARGSAEAFDALVLRHQRGVYALARRLAGSHDDADDIAQEAFLQAWRSLGRYDGSRPFRPWLYGVAANTALKFLRGKRGRREAEIDSADGLPEVLVSPGPDPLAEASSRSELAAVRRAAARLGPEERLILHLRAEEEMSYQEIAETLQVPPGTVMSRLHRARRAFRRLVAEEGVELAGGERAASGGEGGEA